MHMYIALICPIHWFHNSFGHVILLHRVLYTHIFVQLQTQLNRLMIELALLVHLYRKKLLK